MKLGCVRHAREARENSSLSIRPSYGVRGEEILDGGTSLPFSLPLFPFSPETPDTQAREFMLIYTAGYTFALRE